MLRRPDCFVALHSLPRCEPVAEGATRRALHDGLGAVQADLAFADRRDVEIRLANQQRTELWLAQGAEEFGEAAARDVDVQRLLVVAQDFDLDLLARDLAEHAVARRPFAPRAALDASPMAANNCFDQARKACFTTASALSLPSSARNARSTGTRT